MVRSSSPGLELRVFGKASVRLHGQKNSYLSVLPSQSTSMGGGISAGGGLNHNGHEELESLYKKVENINKDIGERKSDLQKNFKTLPERADNDKLKPRTSRWGHRMLINNLKRIKQERLSDIRLLLQKAGMAADVIETVLQDVVGDVPIVFYYDYSATHRKYYRGIDVTPQM